MHQFKFYSSFVYILKAHVTLTEIISFFSVTYLKKLVLYYSTKNSITKKGDSAFPEPLATTP